ncbi:MAG: hypothetical protein JWM41_2885 [Gemmatimonadetes bacterium]|nr:hypothetical protein [Gemmatimonadota bacterium]
MIAPSTSALGAAFDQAHSRLYDLSDEAPSVVALVEYRQRPVDFAVEMLGVPRHTLEWALNPGYYDENSIRVHRWDGQAEPIVAMLNAVRDGLDVCVEAATGTQKSFTCAVLVLWFLACWEGAIVKTFAPTEAQLAAYMWMEIRKLWPAFQARFPSARLLSLEIRMRGGDDKSWGAAGVAVRKRAGEEVSVGAQGMHAPHMLLIYEEAPGIEYPVILAGENTCTAPHNIRVAVGNPDNKQDSLHRFGFDDFDRPREGLRCIRISALDHPNVVSADADIVPGAASVRSVSRRLADYGEQDRIYKSRVRGLSPDEAADALIKLEWVRRAQLRWESKQDREILEARGKGQRSLGVDVANSESGDKAAIARFRGAVCTEVDAFACPDANNLGYQVHLEVREQSIDDDHVGIDGVGVGAGTVNKTKEDKHTFRSLLGGNEPEGFIDDGGEPMEENWSDLRSQMWWILREDLRRNRIALPPDKELEKDLITPTWESVKSKITVESKRTLKKRLGHSPNKGDAVVYGNYVRPRDPVVSERPKAALSIRERVLAELNAMDEGPAKAKKYHGTMRQ